MFSKACEYGIKAVIFIAIKSKEGVRVGLTDIAAHINSPVAFTAKILQNLKKHEIILSLKGPTGGFEIPPQELDKIMLSQIVSAIDGDAIYNGCGLGFSNCNENKPCPVHYKFKAIRETLKQMLETTSLDGLSNDINLGITFLKQ